MVKPLLPKSVVNKESPSGGPHLFGRHAATKFLFLMKLLNEDGHVCFASRRIPLAYLRWRRRVAKGDSYPCASELVVMDVRSAEKDKQHGVA